MSDIEKTNTVIVGAGQAGLAVSAVLSRAGVEHLLIERGSLAERWRSERWDSLRLLTPNWMTRLPGIESRRENPDGFMTGADFIGLLEDYAASFEAPVREGVTVTSVRPGSRDFEVETDVGPLRALNVVVATGQCGARSIPALARGLDPRIHQLHSADYRSPEVLPEGGCLVVGAGASGLQIAAELRGSGRDVILATSRHARAIRRYRGKDLWWWLEQSGSLDDTVDDVADLEAARRTPSLGLTGAGNGRDIDLGILSDSGVHIGGRLRDCHGTRIVIGDDLAGNVAKADRRLWSLLDRFDELATRTGMSPFLPPPYRPRSVRITDPVLGSVDLEDRDVRTVVWATGYRPAYPFLGDFAVGDDGEIVHRRGITPTRGLFVVGLRFQWRRSSHLIDGVGRDAEYIGERIAERTAPASRRGMPAGTAA